MIYLDWREIVDDRLTDIFDDLIQRGITSEKLKGMNN